MAIFESLVNALKALAVGDRVKVTFGRKPDSSQSYGRQITQRMLQETFCCSRNTASFRLALVTSFPLPDYHSKPELEFAFKF